MTMALLKKGVIFYYNKSMKLNVIQPYSDDKLTYNSETNRYELTLQYCKDNFDPTFKDDGVLEKRIKKNTRSVYSFILSRVNTYNKPVVDFLLRRTEEGRKFMLELLSVQMEADVETGYNDLGMFSPVNLGKGQVLDRNEIKRNLVSVDTEQLFYNSAAYVGLNLGYQGVFPPLFFQLMRNNQ